MVRVSDSDSWQRIFQLAVERSRWDLADIEVSRYLGRSFDYIVDLLSRMELAEPMQLDPAGDAQLRAAKSVRRAALRVGGERLVTEEADKRFGMPPTSLRYATAISPPLFLATGVTSDSTA
jgi:hypothetical protein